MIIERCFGKNRMLKAFLILFAIESTHFTSAKKIVSPSRFILAVGRCYSTILRNSLSSYCMREAAGRILLFRINRKNLMFPN